MLPRRAIVLIVQLIATFSCSVLVSGETIPMWYGMPPGNGMMPTGYRPAPITRCNYPMPMNPYYPMRPIVSGPWNLPTELITTESPPTTTTTSTTSTTTTSTARPSTDDHAAKEKEKEEKKNSRHAERQERRNERHNNHREERRHNHESKENHSRERKHH